MEKKQFRSILLLITYAVLLVAAFIKFDLVLSFLSSLLSLLTPIFIAIAIAYILNRPFSFFERNLSRVMKGKSARGAKPIALTVTYLLFLLVLASVLLFIIPQIAKSISMLIDNISGHMSDYQAFIGPILKYFKLDKINLSTFNGSFKDIFTYSSTLLTNIIPNLFNFTSSVARTAFYVVIGFIISIYILNGKKHLKAQFADVTRAFLPEKIAEKVIYVGTLTSRTLTHFVNGQLTEAVILGSLCFLCMSIFGFEYAPLISVIIAVTNLIPLIGLIIGIIPSVLILLMVNPPHALWFVVMILVLQQIEGNLIYPHVVGDSVGLPAIWLLIAIIIGGGFFGILGMVVSVPLASVLYQLLRIETQKILTRKHKKGD